MTEDLEDKRTAAHVQYEEALTELSRAQKKMEEALRVLHREGEYPSPPRFLRFSLSDERKGMTHKFQLGAAADKVEGYVTSGTYSDGKLGEIFVVAEKQGSFVSGLLDSFATVFSIALQFGVPLERLTTKFRHTRFEPSGYTQDKEIRTATSVLDYMMQWLELRYLNEEKDDGTTPTTDE